ncbi:MAG: glycine C-acetyltransferase [Flavobacteriales bacterium]|nr:glycine C-acetyltransferase [Flavobacteriales bacterium]|tara:strand:- start:3054 stop:4244 length:1191 start_codon:yes stop_codon:yes gene_type:complete
MQKSFQEQLLNEIKEIKSSGLYKDERIILNPQSSNVLVDENKEVLNFCANNYLGLSSNLEVVNAAKNSLETHGYGMSSVRFICGTQNIHKELERKISEFLEMEDTILYAAAFDANGGLFEPLFDHQDAIISDELNHASIIDGIRLCKAKRFRYLNCNMHDLEDKLKQTKQFRNRIIVTDGVFSMDGYIAKLKTICDLAQKYKALVMVDDSHATGFIGKRGKGTHEFCDVMGRVDIITSTLGKALGGAMGGFTSAKKEVIDILRQKSRPYLFSNSLAPSIVGGAIKVLDILSKDTGLRDKLEQNTMYFRNNLTKLGFDINEGVHPIVPVMLYDAKLAQEMSNCLMQEGVYAIGFYYPVVARGKARIRVQISASHTKDQLDKAIFAFNKVGKKLNILK